MGSRLSASHQEMTSAPSIETRERDAEKKTAEAELRPKVLLVSPLPPPEGGVATWTQRFLGSDVAENVALHHLNTALNSHDDLSASLPSRAVRSLAALFRFAWSGVLIRPKVVHLTTNGFAGFYRDMLYVFIAKAIGAKVILNIRFGDLDRFLGGVPAIARPLVKASLRACWCLVPITSDAAKVAAQTGNPRVEIIPNCVDIRDDHMGETAADAKSGLRVLYVGWVIPAKGITELIKAVGQVDGATLTMIGPAIQRLSDGDERWAEKVISELNLEEQVKLAGRVEPEQARAAYRTHDVLALPSHREGFSNVVIEAMEAGIPVVATGVGANPEILRDSTDGFIVGVRDVDHLADRLQWLRDHPVERENMGRSARERVKELYSVERVSAMWVNLYRRAIAKEAVASS